MDGLARWKRPGRNCLLHQARTFWCLCVDFSAERLNFLLCVFVELYSCYNIRWCVRIERGYANMVVRIDGFCCMAAEIV